MSNLMLTFLIFYEKKKETIPELWKYDIVKCKVF